MTSDTPSLFVHHGVGRNGRDYRDYWLRLVDDAGILAIAIEFSEQAFPDYLWYHFGNLHTRTAHPIRGRNGPTASTTPVRRPARPGPDAPRDNTACSAIPPAGSSCTVCCRSAIASTSRWPSAANAGTYAMPDLEIAWPFGLGDTELAPDALRPCWNSR